MKIFSLLDFQGTDAAPFLQGYVTADLDDLRPDRALPMALCNIKGRVIANGWAAGEPSFVRLLIHASVADILTMALGKYLAFAKSKLTESSHGVHFAAEPSRGAVALPPTNWFATFDAPADANHEAFAHACIEASFVTVQQETSGTSLPQMIGLTAAGAVSFAKGCYLGQEVVARAEHLGEVKQKLRRYHCQGTPPPVGSDVLDDQNRKVGSVSAVGNDTILAATRTDESPLQAGECRLNRAPATTDGSSLSTI